MDFHSNFKQVRRAAVFELLENGRQIRPSNWQGVPIENPMFETVHFSFGCFIPADAKKLAMAVQPNLPWAENHFLERVGGVPLNPGNEYKNWPYFRGNVEKHQTEGDGQFTHSYMERIWPKQANLKLNEEQQFGVDHLGEVVTRYGIRYEYGDLNDVVKLLHRDPTTRQAYLPIWFPEDTGAVHGGRVPCSLGYWFYYLPEEHRLECTYYIRSCDIVRHFRDDIYLACRKTQWMIEQLRKLDSRWDDVLPGRLVMHIGSLHCWEQEKNNLKRMVVGE